MAEPLARIEINIEKAGLKVEYAYKDDIIKATVVMTDFPNLSIVQPSLHFNPAVVKVCNSAGSILPSAVNPSISFFEKGEAFSSGNWGGVIRTASSSYPFLRNDTGVIGISIDSANDKSLIGTQTVFSVYFKAISEGDADIRLTEIKDGDGKTNAEDYYDSGVFADTPIYAIYYPDGKEIVTYPPWVLGMETKVNFIPPLFYVAFSDSEAKLFNQNNQNITKISQLKKSDTIYAVLDKKNYTNEPELILAVYDDGRLFSFEIGQNVKTGLKTDNISLPEDISKCTIKIFRWKDFTDIEPECKFIHIE